MEKTEDISHSSIVLYHIQ